MHHQSNTHGSSVFPSSVPSLMLSSEEWGTYTQRVQTLKFKVLKLNENVELHLKKQNEK